MYKYYLMVVVIINHQVITSGYTLQNNKCLWNIVTTWWFIPRIVSGLVHPSYKWTLPPRIPLKSPGLFHPLTIRGMSHQVHNINNWGVFSPINSRTVRPSCRRPKRPPNPLQPTDPRCSLAPGCRRWVLVNDDYYV